MVIYVITEPVNPPIIRWYEAIHGIPNARSRGSCPGQLCILATYLDALSIISERNENDARKISYSPFSMDA